MKNIKLLGIIALIAIIGFGAAACGDGGGPEDEFFPQIQQLPPAETLFSVSGTFEKAPGQEVSFELSSGSALSSVSYRSARAIDAASYAISGILEDGDILFRLKGTYDPIRRTYTVSAASSNIRYTINGAVDSSGNSLGSIATLAVKTGETWNTYTVPITEGAVAIDESKEEAEEVEGGGIPAFARGWWYYSYSWVRSIEINCLVSEWSITGDAVITEGNEMSYESQKMTVAEINSLGGNAWDVVFAYPVYQGTDAQIDAAVTAYKNEKNLGTVTKLSGNPWPQVSYPYIYIHKEEDPRFHVLYSSLLSNVEPYSQWSFTEGESLLNVNQSISENNIALASYFHEWGYYGARTLTKAEYLEMLNPPYYNLNYKPLEEWFYIQVGGGYNIYGNNLYKIEWDSNDYQTIQDILRVSGTSVSESDMTVLNAIFTKYGYTDVQITTTDPLPPPPSIPAGYYYWIEDYEVNWGYQPDNYENFGEAQWDAAWAKLNAWYSTNYLEKYLVSINAATVTRYAKNKIVFTNGNTRMNVYFYGTPVTEYGHTWYENEFTSLSAARSVATLDPEVVILVRR